MQSFDNKARFLTRKTITICLPLRWKNGVGMGSIKSAEIGTESYSTTFITEQDAFFIADCLHFCLAGRKVVLLVKS